MKMRRQQRHGARRRREAGLVTVLVLILIVLAGIYVEANTRTLRTLRAELDWVEQHHAVSKPANPEPGP